MNVKQCLSSSLMLTLVTGKHVFFISAGDQLREESQVKKIMNNYPISIFVTELGMHIISFTDYQISD